MATKKKSSPQVSKKKTSVKSVVLKSAAAKSGATKKSVSAKKSVAKRAPVSVPLNGSKSGLYTVPSGNVSVSVPAFWTLRQTNDDLEVEGPSGKTSVIITAFQRQKDFKALDAREYMQHFLETANSNGRLRADNGTKLRSSARFRDVDGDNWEVLFLTNGNTLLLATCNSSEPRTGKESKIGLKVLDSLKLKGSK